MSASLEILFSSTARVRVLGLFLLNPGEKYYQREIERQAGQPIRAVQREVERLEEAGLLVRTPEGQRVFYCLNRDHPLLPELTALFRKAAGPGEEEVAAEQQRAAPPPPPAARQPFPWMESAQAGPLPEALRQRQAEREWDGAY